jgi:hypothetical protein
MKCNMPMFRGKNRLSHDLYNCIYPPAALKFLAYISVADLAVQGFKLGVPLVRRVLPEARGLSAAEQSLPCNNTVT